MQRWPGKMGKMPSWPINTGVIKTVSGGALLVYCLLVQARVAEDRKMLGYKIRQGETFAGVAMLAGWSGMRERAVRRALAELERKALIGKRRARKTDGSYRDIYRVLSYVEYLKKPPAHRGAWPDSRIEERFDAAGLGIQ